MYVLVQVHQVAHDRAALFVSLGALRLAVGHNLLFPLLDERGWQRLCEAGQFSSLCHP